MSTGKDIWQYQKHQQKPEWGAAAHLQECLKWKNGGLHPALAEEAQQWEFRKHFGDVVES